MNDKNNHPAPDNISPFERIRRTNAVGAEHWSSRDFAGVLGYADYRNFEQVVGKARLACFNSGQRIEDHFVDITEMIEIGKGGQRPVKTIILSCCGRYGSVHSRLSERRIRATRPFCAYRQNGDLGSGAKR